MADHRQSRYARRRAQVSADVQRHIVSEYQEGVRGVGTPSLAKKFRLSRETVRSVIKRSKQHDGDPLTPRGHKRRKLSDADVRVIEKALLANPAATNRQLKHKVQDVVSESTVSRTLRRSKLHFTTRVPSNQEPDEKKPEWKDECRAFVKSIANHVPLNTRIYEDETAVYTNDAPKRVRAPRGKRCYRTKPRYGRKYTLHVYAKRHRVLHWQLRHKNANDEEIRSVAGKAAKSMKDGEVLFWDRLGRSGRAKNPVKQHFNPMTISEFEKRGVAVRYLPRLGKYFNPIELLFQDLKSHFIRPSYRGDGVSLSEEKLKNVIKGYMDEQAPSALPGFFARRANGKEAFENKLL